MADLCIMVGLEPQIIRCAVDSPDRPDVVHDRYIVWITYLILLHESLKIPHNLLLILIVERDPCDRMFFIYFLCEHVPDARLVDKELLEPVVVQQVVNGVELLVVGRVFQYCFMPQDILVVLFLPDRDRGEIMFPSDVAAAHILPTLIKLWQVFKLMVNATGDKLVGELLALDIREELVLELLVEAVLAEDFLLFLDGFCCEVRAFPPVDEQFIDVGPVPVGVEQVLVAEGRADIPEAASPDCGWRECLDDVFVGAVGEMRELVDVDVIRGVSSYGLRAVRQAVYFSAVVEDDARLILDLCADLREHLFQLTQMTVDIVHEMRRLPEAWADDQLHLVFKHRFRECEHGDDVADPYLPAFVDDEFLARIGDYFLLVWVDCWQEFLNEQQPFLVLLH